MIVDLRSDTVTRPTPEMYQAMQNAALGDDVLGDEPTVMQLEKLAASMTGKEAAVFVPSGTMGNQIAIASHCQPGDAILIEEDAHMLYYEVGAPAVISGVVSWTLPSRRGIMEPSTIEKRILKANLHTPGTTLLCLENSHNRGGGSVIPVEMHRAYRQVADKHGLRIHLDGARVFNAAIALGVPVQEIADQVDSINFCLSKGLRSPVGSLLCGNAEFIERARIWRKRLGGGMRQAGILAACGLVSLTKMVDRLAEDHSRARRFAEAVNQVPGFRVDLDSVETNIVLIQTDTPAEDWPTKLEAKGIRLFPFGPNVLRAVFHADVSDEQTHHAIEVFRTL